MYSGKTSPLDFLALLLIALFLQACSGKTAVKQTTGAFSTHNARYSKGQKVRPVKQLKQRMDRVKASIRETKPKAYILPEKLLRQASGAKGSLTLHVKNNISSELFYLLSVKVYLDQTLLYQQKDRKGSLQKETSFLAYQGPVLARPGLLQVELEYRGNGYKFSGIPSHYRILIKTTHTFAVKKNQHIALKAIAFDKSFSLPLSKRLDLQFQNLHQK